MLNTADAKKAMQLHEEITKIASQLTEAEDKWVALSEELADA
jgi:ATP-binding cassette subfamily F protein 3